MQRRPMSRPTVDQIWHRPSPMSHARIFRCQSCWCRSTSALRLSRWAPWLGPGCSHRPQEKNNPSIRLPIRSGAIPTVAAEGSSLSHARRAALSRLRAPPILSNAGRMPTRPSSDSGDSRQVAERCMPACMIPTLLTVLAAVSGPPPVPHRFFFYAVKRGGKTGKRPRASGKIDPRLQQPEGGTQR
mmetsp:Transcript_9442/g.22734  ORF Transcript_9442/g.22734 Transcript_9442/m.22734 type:complete len:186 (+) Transcript_9442:222-779(+)